MTTAKRHSIKIRIEQQRSKPVTAASKELALFKALKSSLKKPELVAASALCSVALSIGFYAYSPTATDIQMETAAQAQAMAASLTNASELAITPLATIAEVKQPLFPKQAQLKVGQGDTLIELLTDTGVTHEEAFEAVTALRKIYDPRRINSGQELDVTLEASKKSPDVPSLSNLKMPISSLATIELHKIENGQFVVKKVEVPVTAHPQYKQMTINGSFYETARKANLSPKMIMELMKGFSHDVDFQRDVKRGDKLEVVIDELKREDGTVVGAKNLRFARLDLGRKDIGIYRYTDQKGHTEFYNENGESLKRGLLRTPVDGARISSNYGMRKHPVLGYNKMHKGMDFAASTGTPIYAAGDGVIDYAGKNGGYGNYVRVKHNSKYATAYAHAHRFAKGIRKGVKVRQGQVIAYVGTTGRSTGPHLHYEVLAYGKQTNPTSIQKFNAGTKLAGTDLTRFKAMLGEIKTAKAQSDTTKTVASKASKSTKPKGA